MSTVLLNIDLSYEEITSITFLLYIVFLWIIDRTNFGRTFQFIADYLALIRIQYHASFIFIIAIILYGPTPLVENVVYSVIRLFVSFNILFYGGIYIMNAITDMKEDSLHATKSKRPIASGRISLMLGISIMSLSFLFGFYTAFYWFGLHLVRIYLLFFFVNVFYSFIARKFPYIDILCNAITYSLRTYMASTVILSINPPYSILGVSYGIGLIMGTSRRLLEYRVLGWLNNKGRGYSADGLKMTYYLAIGFFSFTIVYSFYNYTPYILYLSRILLYAIVFIIGCSGKAKRKDIFFIFFIALAVNSYSGYLTLRMPFIKESFFIQIALLFLAFNQRFLDTSMNYLFVR